MKQIYRLLEPGEITQRGDEYLSFGSWFPVEATIGERVAIADNPHRRRMTLPEPGWPEARCVKTDPPTSSAVPFLYWHEKDMVWHSCTDVRDLSIVTDHPHTRTHWLPQPPPPVQKEPWELAWDNYNHEKAVPEGTTAGSLMQGAFRAGFEAAGRKG